MKKLPIIIVSVGCIITGLLGIGFAISLLLGIISLWFIKRKGN